MVYCCMLHPDDTRQSTVPAEYCLPVSKKTLFKNCNIFDGVSETLLLNHDVFVQDKSIVKIAPTGTLDIVKDLTMDPNSDLVLDCEGKKTLMPGLIDCHWHSVLAEIQFGRMISEGFQYMTAIAVQSI